MLALRLTGFVSLSKANSSLRLDTGRAYHLAPLFGFVGDQLAERGWLTGQRHVAEVGEAGVELGIDKPGVDRFVQNLDDLATPCSIAE